MHLYPVEHTRLTRRFQQEGALALVGIDEMHFAAGHDGEDQAGKTRAGTEIGDRIVARRQQRQQLRGVQKMPPPQLLERILGDEIDLRLPLPQQGGIGLEGGKCFT